MNQDQVLDLLSLIAAYDGRTVGQSDLHTWSDAAERGRWTYPEACEAVQAHYAENPDWLKHGHVAQRIKQLRSQPAPQQHVQIDRGHVATAEHRRKMVRWFADHLDANRDNRPSTRDRQRAWNIACPYCGAQPRKSCWQTSDSGQPTGKHMSEPHRQRLADVKEQTESFQEWGPA